MDLINDYMIDTMSMGVGGWRRVNVLVTIFNMTVVNIIPTV